MTIQTIESDLFLFGDGSIRVDRIGTHNQEWTFNNLSKQVQPYYSGCTCFGGLLNNPFLIICPYSIHLDTSNSKKELPDLIA